MKQWTKYKLKTTPFFSQKDAIKEKATTRVGISFPDPKGTLSDIDEWMDKEEDEEDEEALVLSIDLSELIELADPFDDRAYLPIREINLYQQQQEELLHWHEEEEVTEKIFRSQPDIKERVQTHQKELRHLTIFCTSLFAFGMLPYTSNALADYRPWVEGEQPPLIGLWTGNEIITEGVDGSLIAVQADIPELIEELDEIENTELVTLEENIQEQKELAPIDNIASTEIDPDEYFGKLEPHSPAVPEPLYVPEGSLDDYFSLLSAIEDGTASVARALVWGDSTIANDGIIKDVRKRMQDRFGDAGPGFLAVQVDPRWSFRRDIVRKSSGSWKTKTIVFGGADDSRYGLAGTVSKAQAGAEATLGGIKTEDGERQDIHHFQVFYQKQPNGGQLKLSTQSAGTTLFTENTNITDSYYDLYAPAGDPYLYISTQEAPVTIYGVAMETADPGVTWETFGVAGSSIASMQKQHDRHISEQIKARDPSLIVYWTGGNELGYPSVRSKSSKVYKRIYRKVVRGLREGAPSASCLLIGPLDQATKENGAIVSKKTLDNIIHFQREVAKEEGCAYWDARAAMGGKDSFAEWLNHTPTLASPDLAHLTGRGRKRIGDTLADVLMREYDVWRLQNPDIFWEPPESIQGNLWDTDIWECEQLTITESAFEDEDSCISKL